MNKKKLFTFYFVGILLVGMVVLVTYLINMYRQPLGQQLTLIPRATSTAPSGMIGTSTLMVQTTAKPVGVADSASSAVCGQSGAFTLLIIGSDAEDLRGRPGSDLTRLARIDFSHKKVTIFALPRDLWVDVGSLGFQNPNISNTTLGQAYYEAHVRSVQIEETGKMADGALASAQMILDNFGATSDHYLVVDLNQLPAMIDAIGGLPIDIPEPTTDPWIGMVIEAGPQTLTGEQLKAYARAIPDSDFARIQRNNAILFALRQKLLDPAVWTNLPTLYDQFKNMISTDLSPQQIVSFFCLIKQVSKEEIIMGQVKPEWTSPGPSDSLLWDKDKVFSVLEELNLLP
jgi:LCP family protein required for cell wall assembly